MARRDLRGAQAVRAWRAVAGARNGLSERNEATILFGDGSEATLPWSGISWAKPFIDRETTGPAPEAVSDVLAVGDIIYVMPTTSDSWALAQVPEAQSAVVSIDPYDGAVTRLAAASITRPANSTVRGRLIDSRAPRSSRSFIRQHWNTAIHRPQ